MCVSHHSLQTYLRRKMLFLIFFLSVLLLPFQVTWAVEIAKWDFGTVCSTTATATTSVSASSGVGTAKSGGTVTNHSIITDSTSPINCYWKAQTWPATAIANRYFEFKVDTSGYNNIGFSFNDRLAAASGVSTNAPQNFDVKYVAGSTDCSGTTALISMTNIQSNLATDQSLTLLWTPQTTIDLSAVQSGISNKAFVCLRIYGINAGATGGWWHVDDVTITGDPITLSATISGTGTVTSTPAGINCSSGTCTKSLTDFGTLPIPTINLTAAPSGGSTFTGWSNCSTATTSTITVTMDASKTCVATFTGGTYTLELNKDGAGTGTVAQSGGGTYSVNDPITLTATPGANSAFATWSPSPCAASFNMPANNLICTATFTSTVPAPNMNVKVGSNSITNGDTTAANTDFGNVNVGQTPTKTITIENVTGATAALSLTGSPVTISPSTDFSVVAQPSSSIAAGISVGFDIKFTPTTTGAKTAIVSIENNSSANPYKFTIKGTGVNTAPSITTTTLPSVSKSATFGTVVGTVVATDPENNLKATGRYTTTDSIFSIDDSGVVKVASATNLSALTSSPYSFPVTVTDIGGLTASANISIPISNNPPLTVSLSSSVNENVGTVNGTVSVSTAPSSPLTVNLSSGDTNKATVPASVTITAPTTSANFTMTVVDNSNLSDDTSVTITATATGYTNGTAVVNIVNNDLPALPTLNVSFSPTSISENGGTATGTVTASVAPSSNLAVSLSGSSSRASFSTSVTINAGSPSATFPISGINNSATDGDATVTVTASASGYTNGSGSFTVTDDDVVVTPPTPPPATFGLGLKKDGTGTGKVFSDTGMECGSYCTDSFESSKTVNLSAIPDLGSVFAKFTCSSGETNTQPSLSVRMNAVKICTATFNQVPKYKLSITTTGKATGTVTTQPAAIASCGTGCFEFYEGTQVTLVPQPAAGAAFTTWSSNCNDGKVTINSAGNSCTATFMPLYTLTVATTGTGQGIVTSSPTGIECGTGKTACSKIYGEGVSVTLTPTPATGFAFAGWNPECADGKVTFTSNKKCTASFMPVYTLTVAVAGAPSGKITSDPAGIDCGTICSTTVAAGNKIALIPTASQLGVTFTGWSGDCVSSNLVTMDKNKQCTANFAATGTSQFSSKTYQIKEDAKQAVITVKRVAGATGILTTHYTTADGTAKIDGDYTATNGVLEWKNGDTSDKTFIIPVNFDNDIEGNETLNLRLLNSSSGLRDEAVLTIVDVVVPNALQFFHPVARVNEAEGKIKLTVVRAANSAGKVSVNYATQDKTAVAGQDYTPIQGSLVWENGDMSQKFIEIPILSNPNKTTDTQFNIRLSNPQPANIAVLGPNTNVTVSIINTPTEDGTNHPSGSIEFSTDHYSMMENKGSVEILLKRLGSKVGKISAMFETQDASAVQGVDYIAKQQTVEWEDGDGSDKSLIITIPYDPLPESSKIVNLVLSNPSAGANLGAINKATLLIEDYANPVTTPTEPTPQRGLIQFNSNSYQVEEGGTAILKVSRVNGSKDPMTVKFMTENGSAKTGEDYVGQLGELLWLDGEMGEKTISLSILDNMLRDGSRDFTVSLMPIGTATVSNDAATVTIQDNDNTTVQLTNTAFSANENAGEAVVSVSRQNGSRGNVSVYYQLQEETARAGKDFALTSGRLMWLDGDTTDKMASIKLYDNDTFDGNRTFKFNLHNAENASVGVPSTAVVTIVENDSTVQAECKPQLDSIDCGFDNTNKELGNIKLGVGGTIQGGTINGKVENLGTVQGVTLQPGAQIVGGVVRGTIIGIASATRPARLIAVKATGAILQHVVIDAQSTLDDDVVLGEGVLFESNATIPAVNLAQSLGMMTPPFPTHSPFFAVNLMRDVLFNSIAGGIVTAINELPELKSWGLKLQQNPVSGYLESTLETSYYAVMPVEVRHVLKQLLKGEVRAGISVTSDGSVTFITHTGRWVRTIPVLHDGVAFLSGLQSFGLPHFTVLPNGNLRVPIADTGMYYSGRPGLVATRNQLRSNVALDVMQMPVSINYGDSWQQPIYPTAAQPDAIYTLSQTAVLEQNGQLILKLGTGETQRTFHGIFDYVVTPGSAPQNGESLFYQVEDKDGDGIPDYRMIYPNGEGQLIFAR